MKKILLISVILLLTLSFSSISFANSECYVKKLDVRYDYTWTSGSDYLVKIKATNPINGMGFDEEAEDFNYLDLRWLTRLQIDNPSHTNIINLIIRQIGWHGVRFRVENIEKIQGDTKFEVFIYKGRELVKYDTAIIPLSCDLKVNDHLDVYFGNFKVTKLVKS
ncbi:MAG TPA: hypothetical protein VJH20_02315 [Candidatus Nanoarchaeia archaeon]|nr:hypothetical protein [Candidatus Nanoarchaeia archaeon]